MMTCRSDARVPVGANPGEYSKAPTINPFKKNVLGTAISPSIKRNFFGICSFGEDQLLSCYREANLDLNADDFRAMCCNCPYAVYPSIKTSFANCDKMPFFIDKIIKVEEAAASYVVYFITDGEYVKIGITDNIAKRLNALQTANARKLSVICTIPMKGKKEAITAERTLHRVYSRFLMNGEWFDIYDYIDVRLFAKIFPPKDDET